MDNSVEEIHPNVWRIKIASVTRIVRYRADSRTFAPWDITTADGQALWSASSLESALRWIQARTGYPVEPLFAQALLERGSIAESAEVKVLDESAGIAPNREAAGR